MSRVSTLACSVCGQPVALPPRGWQVGDPAYCDAHYSLIGRDPNVILPGAIEDAQAHLASDLSRVPRWPWFALDEMAGLVLPESVTYVAAFPGNGKTSFVSHCVLHWIRTQQLRVLLLPLEASPREAMARLICLEQGIDPDDALSLRLRQRADAGDVWARRTLGELQARYRAVLEEPEFYGNLMIEPADTLGVRKLTASLDAGAAWGADVIVVDHVDHLGQDDADPRPEIARSTAVQHAVKSFARRTGIPVVLMAQLNSKATGGSRTAYYEPPRMEWLWFKGVKEQIAHVVLGLFRPMRSDLSAADVAKLEPGVSIAEPLTMGVAAMKRRYGGAQRDAVIKLHYEHGLITDRAPEEARGDAADRHGIATRPWWQD